MNEGATRATGYGYSLWEFQVFGTWPAHDTAGPRTWSGDPLASPPFGGPGLTTVRRCCTPGAHGRPHVPR